MVQAALVVSLGCVLGEAGVALESRQAQPKLLAHLFDLHPYVLRPFLHHLDSHTRHTQNLERRGDEVCQLASQHVAQFRMLQKFPLYVRG